MYVLGVIYANRGFLIFDLANCTQCHNCAPFSFVCWRKGETILFSVTDAPFTEPTYGLLGFYAGA